MMKTGLARRSWTYSIGVLIVLVLVHSSAWYVVTSRLEAALPAFVSAAAEQGWRVESGRPERTGWPWASSVTLPDVIATKTVGNAAVRWTAERVDLTVHFLHLQSLWVAPTGDQTVEFPPLAPVRLRAGLAVLRVPLSRQAPSEKVPETLDVHDLAVETAGAGLQMQLLHAEIAAGAATLTADGIELRPALPGPFDGRGDASLRAISKVPLWAGPATAWQSAGGQLALPALTLQWGPLMVTGNGSGRLDGQLQPEGRATLRVTGSMQLVEALARAGLIAPAPASAIRAVLGLLGYAAHGQAITLPVALEDRTLTIAQFPLLRLPHIDWNIP